MAHRNANHFSMLASDSESESESKVSPSSLYEAPASAPAPAPAPAPSPLLSYAPAPETLGAGPAFQGTHDSPFRVWKEDMRFTNTIFNSPFARKKCQWTRPRFKEEEWVSIESSFKMGEKGTPAPLHINMQNALRKAEEVEAAAADASAEAEADASAEAEADASRAEAEADASEADSSEEAEAEEESPEYAPMTPPENFPSLLNRGSQAEIQTALDWAEKVKKSLENSKKRSFDFKRHAENTYGSSRLSFFRRDVVLDEKF